jgi:peptide/nickel transport system substrate-binding protein
LGTREPAGFPLPGYGVLTPYLEALDELYAELKAEDPYLDPFLYDPDKAAEIFERLGYELVEGVWTHPVHGPLKVTLVTYEEEDLVAMVADQLRAGGIDVVWISYPGAAYAEFRNRAEVEMWYHHGGTVFDPHEIVSRWHSRNLMPPGEYAHINYERYLYPDGNPELDALIEAMEAATPLDPDTYVPLFKDAAEIIIRDRIVISLVTTTFMLPYNTEYWTNWPLEENPYMVPAIWWATSLPMIVQLKSTYTPPPAPPPPPPPYELYAAIGAAVILAALSGYLAIRLRRRAPPS